MRCNRRHVESSHKAAVLLGWCVHIPPLHCKAHPLRLLLRSLCFLRSASQHGSDAASHMSARLDPAKRYAVGADPQASAAREGASAHGRSDGGLPQTPSPPDLPAMMLNGDAGHAHAKKVA